MELRVLGPIEVRRDGVPVELPGGKPRIVLARLLVDAGRVVSVDALREALWGDDPPATATGTIQVHVSNLRRAVGATTVVTRPPGYLVPVGDHDLDHLQLEAHVAAARAHRADGRPAEGMAQARAGLDLVRGEPYQDVAFEDWAQAEILRLSGVVLAAHEEVHQALLDMGRHAEAVPSLQALVRQHPFHERLRAQLMLALYRDGRQADALRCFAEGRAALVEELGVDPGPELQQMESLVLGQDESLRAPKGPRRPAPARPPTPRRRSALVGRERERRTVQERWDSVRAGDKGVLVVTGPPGSGKSALLEELVGTASDDGALAGASAAPALDGAPPYWPWVAALRDLAGSGGGPLLAAALDQTPGAQVIADLLDGSAYATTAPLSQFELFDTVARILGRLVGETPVVVVLDDLQWADQASVDLLRFLAQAPTGGGLLLAVGHRHVPPDHRLARALAGVAVDSRAARVALDGLTTEEVHALVVEAAAGAPVELSTSAAIRERTGGNPFYVRELVQLLSDDDGVLSLDRAAVPEAVRASLRERAADLGPHGVEVLTMGSFAGGDFTEAVIGRVLGIDRQAVGRITEAAVAESLLLEVPGQPGFHRFAHDIVRHAFYDAVPQRRRAETHLAIGRAAVELTGADAGRWAVPLATHFAHGIDVGGAGEAVHWLRRASAQAVRSHAYADGVRHLRRALYVALTRLRDERTECEVLIELAAVARLAADPGTAGPARERARALAARLGDQRLAERAADVLRGLGPEWVRRPR